MSVPHHVCTVPFRVDRTPTRAVAQAVWLLACMVLVPSTKPAEAQKSAPQPQAHATSAQATIDALLDDHHYLRAQAPIQARLSHNPNDVTAQIQLSVDQWALRHYDAAITAAERATVLAPTSARAWGQLANADGAKLASSSAGTLEKLSLVRQFRKAADRALTLDPNEVEALQDLARFYFTAPGFAGGDKAKARQTADHLFAVDPYLGAAARANFITSAADPTSGDLSNAGPPPQSAQQTAALIAIWQAALQQRPDSYRSHAALAAVALAAMPPQSALAAAEAERARTLGPGRVQAYKTLAVLDVRAGNWQALTATIQQALSNVPDDRTPEYLAANVILAESAADQYARAEQYLRDYLTQPIEGHEPSAAEAHWRLGLILEREGRKVDAVHELQTAVAMDRALSGARDDLKRLS